MITYEKTLREWENIIRTKLKVTNPSMLKSGALGVLANFLAGIKYDALMYYSKTFQELNVGLAQDFNSMLFHSTIYGVDVELAKPSTLALSIIVPELKMSSVESLLYRIPRFSTFEDQNGIPFIFLSEIQIKLTDRSIEAKSWNPIDGSKPLTLTRAPDPNMPTGYVFLIHTKDAIQIRREFHETIIDSYEVGDSFKFSIGVGDIRRIAKIRVWYNKGDRINIDELQTKDLDFIAESTEYPQLYELNVRFHRFESSSRDPDVFIQMNEQTVEVITGDGIHGMMIPSGSQLIVEVELSFGEQGNIPNGEFIITNCEVEEKYSNQTVNLYPTRLNAISAVGSSGGKTIGDIEDIRRRIFSKITTRNSLTTEADYQNFFEYNNVKPFVDAKFIDAHSFVYLFNALRVNDQVIETTSFNYPLSELARNSFFPRLTYAGVDLISPFYYKDVDENRVDAFAVNPKVNIILELKEIAPALRDSDLRIELAITYDFVYNKSYIEILSGAINGYEYWFNCNIFTAVLKESNDFKFEVSTVYTDSYCIIRDIISDIQVEVRDPSGLGTQAGSTLVALFTSPYEYHQLVYKQQFFKYFQEVEEEAPFIEMSDDTMSFLDNYNRDHMNTVADLFEVSTLDNKKVEPYILRMPFVSEAFFMEADKLSMFELIDQYFIADSVDSQLTYNSAVIQSFYNTIDIPAKYFPYLFEENSNGTLITPKIKIEVHVDVDEENFIVSTFDSTFDLKTSLTIYIIKFLKRVEGFQIEFYETDLEKAIYNHFAPLFRNVRVVSPQLFKVRNPQQIYRDIKKNLPYRDLLEFVPPYFHFDYDNINIIMTTEMAK